MTHRRPSIPTALAACLLLAAACDNPSGPQRPDLFEVTFLGNPAGSLSFEPRDIGGGIVVGTAATAGGTRAVVWSGGFSPVGPAVPAGCSSMANAVAGSFVVGQVTCPAAGGGVDVSGWSAGAAPLGRVTVEPHAFVDVDSVGNIAGNVYPAPYWTAAQRRAFAITGGYVALVPPGASASEAAGIGGDLVAVTADTGCVEGVCAGSRVWAWRGGTWTAVRGLEQAYERAVAVSSDGRILVATVDDDEQETRRAYVVRGGNLRRRRELHMVPGTEAVVRDVSAIGWVVGTGTRSGGGLEGQTEGIAWAVGRLYFLSEHLVDEDWRITSAIAVDDEGRIVGTGVHRVTGLSGPILLTPVR